jgi:hypothetical protein
MNSANTSANNEDILLLTPDEDFNQENELPDSNNKQPIQNTTAVSDESHFQVQLSLDTANGDDLNTTSEIKTCTDPVSPETQVHDDEKVEISGENVPAALPQNASEPARQEANIKNVNEKVMPHDKTSTTESDSRQVEPQSRDDSKTSKIQIDDKILSDMRYLYRNTRYFLIKSNNYENVQIAKTKVNLRKICVLKNKLRISFYNLFPF